MAQKLAAAAGLFGAHYRRAGTSSSYPLWGPAMRELVRCALGVFSLVGVVGLAAACITGTGTSTTAVVPTEVTIAPAAFAGSVPCGKVPGTWKTYVATLTDVTYPDSPFQLASSSPVDCSMSVFFTLVIPLHSYVANIDAYDRDDIQPFGGISSGSPHMIDPKTNADVSPRWTTSCGRVTPGGPDAGGGDGEQPDAAAAEEGAGEEAGANEGGLDAEQPDSGIIDAGDFDGDATDSTPAPPSGDAAAASTDQGPVISLLNVIVSVNNCQPLAQVLPPAETSIVIDVTGCGELQHCGAPNNQIDHVHVIPTDSLLPPRDSACDAPVTYSGVTAGAAYWFRVEAFEKGSTVATWATTCSAVPQAGLATTAVCDSFTTQGAVRVDIASLLASAGRRCAPDDVVSYQTSLTSPSLPPQMQSCAQDAMFSPLQSGTWQLLVDGFNSSDQVAFSAFCEAAVTPASIAVASCQIAPQ